MRSRQKGPLKLGCCRIPTDRILTSELPRFMRVPFEMRDNKDGITHEDKKQRGQAIQRTELSGRVYRRRRPNGTRQGCRDQLRPTRSIRPQSSAGSLPREDFSSPTLPRNALRCRWSGSSLQRWAALLLVAWDGPAGSMLGRARASLGSDGREPSSPGHRPSTASGSLPVRWSCRPA
jgi:hypothetical protein